MDKNKLKTWLPLAPVLIGGSILFYLFFSFKKVLQNNINNLPPTISQFPPQILYWIGLILLITPFIIFKVDKRIRIISLLFFSFFSFFAFPLLSPYGIPYGRDPQYGYQVADNIQKSGFWDPSSGTGQAITYTHYPAMYIINVIFSNFTGVKLLGTFMWLYSLIRFLLIPGLIYLLFKKLLDEDGALLGTFLYLTSPHLTNHPQHEGFAIIFLILALYLIISLTKLKSSEKKFFLIGSVLLIILSHHFTTYILLIWLFF